VFHTNGNTKYYKNYTIISKNRKIQLIVFEWWAMITTTAVDFIDCLVQEKRCQRHSYIETVLKCIGS